MSLLGAASLSSPSGSQLRFAAARCSVTCCIYKVPTRAFIRGKDVFNTLMGEIVETLLSSTIDRNSITSPTPLVTQSAFPCLTVGLCCLVSLAVQHSISAALVRGFYVRSRAWCFVCCNGKRMRMSVMLYSNMNITAL